MRRHIIGSMIIVLLILLAVTNTSVYSQQREVDIDFSMVNVPEELKPVFAEAIVDRSSGILNGERFFVTWFVTKNEWTIAMIASAGGKVCNSDALGAGSQCHAKLLLHRNIAKWESAFPGTAEYTRLLSQVPHDFAYDYGLQSYDSRRLQFYRTTPSPKFPWHYSQSWKFTQGFYGFSHNGEAEIDLAPPSFNDSLYALTDGRMSVICPGQATLNIEIEYENGHTEFFHLDKDTYVGSIDETAFILQGTKIGAFYNGTYGRGWYDSNYNSCTPEPETPEYYGSCDSTHCCYYKYRDRCGIGTGLHAHWLLPSHNVTIDEWTVGLQGKKTYWTHDEYGERHVGDNLDPSSNGLRIQVTKPISGTAVGGLVEFTGWTLDPNETNYSGINWVKLCFGGKVDEEGIECIDAEYGDETSDIGDAYGQQYDNSGWHLEYDFSGLNSGEQFIYVYANDNRAYIKHRVINESYRYEFDDQNPPPSVMLPGDQADVSFTITNTGNLEWEKSTVKLGTEDDPNTPDINERNTASPFWQSGAMGWEPGISNRILMQESNVAIDSTATFLATFTAPDAPDIYRTYFRGVANVNGHDQWMETSPDLWFEIAVCRDDYAPDESGYFCDVSQDHTFFNATHAIATPGSGEVPLTEGCLTITGDDGKSYTFFCPDETILRDHAIVMADRWLYQKPIQDLPPATFIEKVFPDLEDEKAPYEWDLGLRAMQLSFLDGGIRGYSDGTMKPEEKITRREALLIAMKILHPTITDDDAAELIATNPFNDVNPNPNESSYHSDLLILKAAQLYIINPDNDAFNGNDLAPRAHIAAFLYNAFIRDCEKTPNEDGCQAPEEKEANSVVKGWREQARITDDEDMLCFTGSMEAEEKLQALGLPTMGITEDGEEICYCSQGIYNKDKCLPDEFTAYPEQDTEYETLEETPPSPQSRAVAQDNDAYTRLFIPAGAVSEATDMAYLEAVLPKPKSNYAYGGRSFVLQAHRHSTLLPNFEFENPISVTLAYPDDYAGITEQSLRLYYWDQAADQWLDAACGPYNRDLDNNILTVPVCRVGEFALFRINPETQTVHTVVPMGDAQTLPQAAYRAILENLYDHEQTRWAASVVGIDTLSFFDPGTFVAPYNALSGSYNLHYTTDMPEMTRSYALQPGGVGVLRTTVRAEGGEAASWELAHIRDVLDVYLFGALPYDILEESDLSAEALADYDLLIVPSVHLGLVDEVVAALDAAGALDALAGFVRDGGTLYTQGNGAIVAQAAGLVPDGTVDLEDPIRLTGPDTNRGQIEVVAPDSPLVYSLITDTLYILTDPTLHPAEGHQVVATLSNAETADTPALVQAEVDAGQVIMQVGHPTDRSRRQQIPLFMDAVLTALSSKAELTGQAAQTFNPAFPSDVFPAYEAEIPVNATLRFANLWDAPLSDVVVTATVANGFNVLQDSIMPPPTAVYHLTAPLTQTQIVWALGTVDPGEIIMSYVAETEEDVLAPGEVTFDESVATYQKPAGEVVSMRHWDTLRSLMAARLVGDRDLEPDRAYRVPAKGVYLDVALPLENKESTLASNLVLTDVVYLIYPIVDLEDQHTILSTNDGETIWMRNEPFFWGDARYPLPRAVTSPTATLTLEDWNGEWCTFTSTYGIHVDPPFSGSLQLRDYGSFITIPPTYTGYITVTAENELLLPCLTMEWELGDFPGYWYEEPAVRYGVHSRELFNRMVTFVGDPDPEGAVVDATGGSVYVNAGSGPVLYRAFMAEATPYAAQPPTQPRLTWTDVWLRTGEMPLRASFYDVFDWASCTTCGSYTERHAAVNVTFGMMADLDGDGVPETPVRELPTRLSETALTLMVKSYNLGRGIPYDQNLIDLPMFNGLGVKILPRYDAWWNSWSSPLGHSDLVSVTHTPGYDHLYFQQDVPKGVAEVFYVDGTVQTYEDLNREGMFKLHDGARFHYRQVHAGVNRYETYDSHVHGVVGLSSDAEVDKVVGPARVSVYGDDIYYLFTMDDPYDPRTFDEDPYLQSWGYGDLVATTYIGGREDKTLFHSILSVGDRTWLRVQIDNNHGEALTGVDVAPQPPAGINVTPLFTKPGVNTVPDPIWPELAFLSLEEIPDAWRGVYYFELQVTAAYTGPLDGVLRIPIAFSADNPPAGFEIPPATLALRGAGGAAPQHVYGPATQLTLTDTLPSYVNLERAVQLDQAQVNALWRAIDAGQAMTVFAGMSETVPFDDTDNVVSFTLPVTTLPAMSPVYIAARAHITPAQHGPNLVNQGAVLGYQDPFAKQWTAQSQAATVEALGAAVWINYYCEGGVEGSMGARVYDDGGGTCWVPADEPSQILVRLTPYNDGDDVAEAIVANVQLPEGVRPISAEPTWLQWLTDTNRIFWELGDLAPGGYKALEIIMQVEPASKERGESHAVIQHSDGSFTDAFSGELVEGRFGQDFAVWVQGRYYALYLPTLFKQYNVSPDLVVESAAVTAADPDTGQDAAVTVVIKNQGDAPVRPSDEFWVDLYVAPDPAPTAANDTWQHLCSEGIAWGVTAAALPLAPGESITLTLGDAYYLDEQSVFSGLLDASTPLYVQVDSAHADTDYGAVMEGHEISGGDYNNVYGPMFPSVP